MKLVKGLQDQSSYFVHNTLILSCSFEVPLGPSGLFPSYLTNILLPHFALPLPTACKVLSVQISFCSRDDSLGGALRHVLDFPEFLNDRPLVPTSHTGPTEVGVLWPLTSCVTLGSSSRSCSFLVCLASVVCCLVCPSHFCVLLPLVWVPLGILLTHSTWS